MTIKVIKRENGADYLLIGRLDSVTAPEVEELLLQAAVDCKELTLDLKDLDYISSAGLRVIKKIYVSSSKQGHSFVIKNTKELVMEVFQMTGFAGILKFE